MAVPQKQSVKINFSGGLDTKIDPWQVDASEFLALNNMVFDTGGRLTKRNGFKAFGTSVNTTYGESYSKIPANISAARKVFAYSNELLLNDAWNLYSYDKSNDSWVYKGRSTSVDLTTQAIASGDNTYNESDCSVDTLTGVKFFVYATTNGQAFYSIQDIATGQFIINQSNLNGITSGVYSKPRVVSIPGFTWIFWVHNTNVQYQAFVGSTLSGSQTTLVSGLVGSSDPARMYDIGIDEYSNNFYLSYYGAGGVTLALLTKTAVIGITSSLNIIGTVSDKSLSWFGDGTNIWVIYNDGVTRAFIVNNAVTSVIVSPIVIDASANSTNCNNVTGVWSADFNSAFIFTDQLTQSAGITTVANIWYITATYSGSVLTAAASALFMGSVNLNSKAFLVDGVPNVVALYTLFNNVSLTPSLSSTVPFSSQPTTFLLNLYNVDQTMNSTYGNVVANIAGKALDTESQPFAPKQGYPRSVAQSASGVWDVALLKNVDYAFEAPTLYNPSLTPTGVVDCTLDFNLSNPDAIDLGTNGLIAGANVKMYDGSNVCEQNFDIYPNYIVAPTVGTGTPPGGASSGALGLASYNSLYSYILVYEWIDNQGQVHRSFPSTPITAIGNLGGPAPFYSFLSGTTNGYVGIKVPYLQVTNKPGTQIVINIYRTTANGSVYYLLGNPTGLAGAYGTIKNNPYADSAAIFYDVYSDNQIIGNTQLYTTGALGYFAPPASKALSTWKNRAIAVPSEQGNDFFYANKTLVNFPVQFVPEFDQNVGTVAGPIVTVAGMDDKLIIFKSGEIAGPSILYMVGNGPAQSGANSDFQDPLPVAVDVGCVDRPSVVMTPVGLMFKSAKGIYLLDRGLSASYIGAGVQGYNRNHVLSAQLIPNTTQVRFLIDSGTMLVYDYFWKKWATFTPPSGGVSDCIFGGLHTYVTSSGQVYQESPGVYADGAAAIPMSFTTAWVKLAGLQGYQRAYFLYLLSEWLSAHQLQVNVAYDFSDTPSQSSIITPTNTVASLESWRIFLAKQRCQSFQLTITEIPSGSPGAGFTMSGMNLIVGVKSSFRTIAAAQTVG